MMNQQQTQVPTARIPQAPLYGGTWHPEISQLERLQATSFQNGAIPSPQFGGFGSYSPSFSAYTPTLQPVISQQPYSPLYQNSLYSSHPQWENAYASRVPQPQFNAYRPVAFGGVPTGISSNVYTQGVTPFAQSYSAYHPSIAQQQINRIHQNSLYNGQQQPIGGAYAERIHQATMQNGTLAQPQLNAYRQTGIGAPSVVGAFPQPYVSYNQSYAPYSQSYNTFAQGLQPSIVQQQLERIQQYPLYSQPQPESAYVERLQQATVQGGAVSQPQFPQYRSTVFGAQPTAGYGTTVGMTSDVYNQVMNADVGIREAEVRTDVYPQSMYTGYNQYDTVNQAVLNQMTHGMGRQF